MKNREFPDGTVYYLSCDIGHGTQAQDLSAAQGLRVEVLFPKDLPAPPDALVLIVDLDYLWLDAHGRRDWLAEVSSRPLAALTVVHSYDFVEGEGPCPENVLPARRFDGDLLGRLAARLAAARKSAA
jgi:hypothetical protein